MIARAEAPRVAVPLDRALSFLERSQHSSGQFPMEFVASAFPGTGAGLAAPQPANTPFCTALVAHSLSFCDDVRTRPMIARAVAFLENDRVRGDLWRYWCRDDPLHRMIPADVDDTACVSALLAQAGSRSLRNRRILLGNRDARGLFYTWITPRATPHVNLQWLTTVLADVTPGRVFAFWNGGAARDDVDSVVNANVLFYLGEIQETDPVIRWLLDVAEHGTEKESDKWYRSRAAFYYAVSKCYARGITRLEPAKKYFGKAMQTMLHGDGKIGGDVIQTALALCAHMNFGLSLGDISRSVDYLLSQQAADGSWESCPIYYDGRDIPQITHGSKVVTTGFCVEVLSRLS